MAVAATLALSVPVRPLRPLTVRVTGLMLRLWSLLPAATAATFATTAATSASGARSVAVLLMRGLTLRSTLAGLRAGQLGLRQARL